MPIPRRGVCGVCVLQTQKTILGYQSITSNVQKSASEAAAAAAAAVGASSRSSRRNGGPQSGSRRQSSSDGRQGHGSISLFHLSDTIEVNLICTEEITALFGAIRKSEYP